MWYVVRVPPMLGAEVILEGFTEENQAIYTPEEEARMLEEASGSGEEGRSGGSVHRRRPSAVRRGNQQCHYSRAPQIQQNLLERVAEINENIAVVLFSGRPLGSS